MSDILIIDCDRDYGEQLAGGLVREGLAVDIVDCFHEGLSRLAQGAFAAVVLDEDAMPVDVDEMLRYIRAICPAIEVIVLSYLGDPDKAEAAIRAGAWNFFRKPISPLRLKVVLERILELRDRTPADRTVALKRENIVGNSRALQICLDEVARAAATDANTMISGETGTGKELFARAVHVNSSRSAGNFVVVDCAALPKALAASVLFGHEKGAFTSADASSKGLVREANGGTLFLDEIGELPLSVQKVFLRVLESRSFRPVGATREVVSDFRLVSATNRNLEQMSEQGTFRRDLYYRLKGMTVELPPLRAITEDINEITCFYIGKITARMGVSRKGFAPDFLEALVNYDWPGNIRELINALERALSMAGDEPILFPRHLPTSIRAKMARSSMAHAGTAGKSGATESQAPKTEPTTTREREQSRPVEPSRRSDNVDLSKSLKEFRAHHLARLERLYLQNLLKQCGTDMECALRGAGLSRARFYALLQEHGLHRERKG